jgi:hypothetical protein
MRRIQANRAAATYPVVVAGLLHGVGRDGAKAAAAAGDFPTITVGGQTLALADPINKRLGLSGIDDEKVREAYRLAGMKPPPLPESAGSSRPRVKPMARVALAKPASRKRKSRLRNVRKGETTATALR